MSGIGHVSLGTHDLARARALASLACALALIAAGCSARAPTSTIPSGGGGADASASAGPDASSAVSDAGAANDAMVAQEAAGETSGPAGMDGNASDSSPPPDAQSDAGIALPLSTCGRWIVDGNKRRVKLAGVNWYGASDVKYVVGGLDKVPMIEVALTIRTLGFNVVRLPFSNVMLHVAAPVDPAAVAANPSLTGKTPIQVYDAVVDTLTQAGLLVILNDHTTHAMWCCGFDDDGLWFSSDYTEEQWIADWEMMALRYASNLRVIGADLRNELRPAQTHGTPIPTFPNWGLGDANDWAAAATRAGNRVLAKNQNLIVFVEGIDSADTLTGVAAHPVILAVPNKLAYEAHQYGFFPSPPENTSNPYSGMDAAGLKTASHNKWGYIMDPGQPYTAPVWLGEFGDSSQSSWMSNIGAYMKELDQDFAYWPINGGPKASGGAEPYGLLQDDWTTVRMDGRLAMLQSLQAATRGPGIGGAADACP